MALFTAVLQVPRALVGTLDRIATALERQATAQEAVLAKLGEAEVPAELHEAIGQTAATAEAVRGEITRTPS